MKAFDMVDWDFVIFTLKRFNFPSNMISWIQASITTPRFSINLNGELVGFFPSKRGIRQGDPLSPYLFFLIMEVFTHILKAEIATLDSFKYHWRCKRQKLVQLCFADDLFLFCHGSLPSVVVLKKALDTFQSLSGLSANAIKSEIFISRIPET
ncbi:unnamed protein product [Ilex paraguariensis]|uniref:Reverse transcriptase domain-containing protein n=1 Tax=Ilex paraguariensis TaxID=185542 RepID=A0ABC8S294_9AQUA